MKVNKKLQKTRTFKEVSCLRNIDLFRRVGSRPMTNMQDGQVAAVINGSMEELEYLDAQVLRENQMPSNEDTFDQK